MQLVSFDFWGWLLGALFFVSTCGVSQPSQSNLNLNMPQHGPDEIAQAEAYAKLPTKLTLILLKDGGYFAYEGLDISKGSVHGKAELRNLILAAKKRFHSPDFVVLIKPTTDTDYAATVDVLDEMTINKIDRYAILNLTPEEAAKLNVKDASE